MDNVLKTAHKKEGAMLKELVLARTEQGFIISEHMLRPKIKKRELHTFVDEIAAYEKYNEIVTFDGWTER
jgi:hypothetical protein